MTTKEELINKLIKDNGYKNYLELGTQYGVCMNQIQCQTKHGVDPFKPVQRVVSCDEFFHMTTDEFFSSFEAHQTTYDIIFIDGLHHADQLLADLCNSGALLTSDGTIVLHDMMPTSEITQRVPRESKEWYGSCWAVGYLLLKGNYDITIDFHNFDCGLMVITFGRKGLDQLLVDFSDNLDRLDHITYAEHFQHYLELLENNETSNRNAV